MSLDRNLLLLMRADLSASDHSSKTSIARDHLASDQSETKITCPACGNLARMTRFTAREMQFGTREEFKYLECSACESLHIEAVPADLSRYYPSQYYSFFDSAGPTPSATMVRRFVGRWLVNSKDPLANLIAQRLKHRRFAFFEWARRTAADFNSKILDVGCGSGSLLRKLKRYGFRHLDGIDPFAPHEVKESGLRIRKCQIDEVDEKFDVILINHVLEHLPDPMRSLSLAKQLLLPGGNILVRIPVAGSFAHRKYGADWVHLDAPRHLVIPSLRGFHEMAKRSGLRVIHQDFDGEEPSFLLSESYQRDVPMARAPRPGRPTRVRYRRLAHRLNAQGQGDFGVFVLAPS